MDKASWTPDVLERRQALPGPLECGRSERRPFADFSLHGYALPHPPRLSGESYSRVQPSHLESSALMGFLYVTSRVLA
jgi:hypothetical protein